MQYEWDEKKRQANIAKHGVDFVSAQFFEWKQALSYVDSRNNYGEERFVSIAPIDGRLHVMVWTPRSDKKRIIGLRKTNPREARYYESKT